MATKKFKCKVCGYVHEGDKAPAKCPVCGAPASEFEEIKEAGSKKKLNTNGNAYTILYAAVMVIVVAFLLAFVSSSLKSTQEKNVQLDTKKQILAALNISDVQDADAEFEKLGMTDMLMQPDGTLVRNEEDFQTLYKGEIAGGRFHVFECKIDGQTKYVIPVYGAGLWGAIWGYVGLDEDRNTVYGVHFSHASETPGLGAEIATAKFQDRFKGKKVSEGETVALGVEKNGKVSDPAFQVDGISGATITSKGVDAMLKSCLGAYAPFFTNK